MAARVIRKAPDETDDESIGFKAGDVVINELDGKHYWMASAGGNWRPVAGGFDPSGFIALPAPPTSQVSVPVTMDGDSTNYRVPTSYLLVMPNADVGSDETGESIDIRGGAGDGTGNGGFVAIYSGGGNVGGTLNIVAAGGTTDGGSMNIETGPTTSGVAGILNIRGGYGGATGAGGSLYLRSGSSGYMPGYLGIYGGDGSWGADTFFQGGKATSTNGEGGSVILGGGAGGSVSGQGGDVILNGGNALADKGGDVLVSPGNATAPSDNGALHVRGDRSLIPLTLRFSGDAATLDGRPVVTATRPMHVVSIAGRLVTAAGGAATATPVKAASTVAFAAGTALTTDTFDLNGTPDAVQSLTVDTTTRELAAGDSIGITTTGSGSCTGTITFWLNFS